MTAVDQRAADDERHNRTQRGQDDDTFLKDRATLYRLENEVFDDACR